jgi:hypothetical protein
LQRRQAQNHPWHRQHSSSNNNNRSLGCIQMHRYLCRGDQPHSFKTRRHIGLPPLHRLRRMTGNGMHKAVEALGVSPRILLPSHRMLAQHFRTEQAMDILLEFPRTAPLIREQP